MCSISAELHLHKETENPERSAILNTIFSNVTVKILHLFIAKLPIISDVA